MEKSAVRTFSPFRWMNERDPPQRRMWKLALRAGCTHLCEKESAFLNGLKLFSTTIRFQFKQSAARAKMLAAVAPNTFYYAPP
jgi:hypothetical protein